MFCIVFQKFVREENLKPDPIFNAEEAELYWKGLPTRTPAHNRQKCAVGCNSLKEYLQTCVVEMHLEIPK
jgi:hypothetical protein